MHGQGPGYQLDGELMLVASFWGKAITVKSAGGFQATLQVPAQVSNSAQPHDCAYEAEQYWWTKPTVTINNIIIGKLWSEPIGTLTVTSSSGAAPLQLIFLCNQRTPAASDMHDVTCFHAAHHLLASLCTCIQLTECAMASALGLQCYEGVGRQLVSYVQAAKRRCHIQSAKAT